MIQPTPRSKVKILIRGVHYSGYVTEGDLAKLRAAIESTGGGAVSIILHAAATGGANEAMQIRKSSIDAVSLLP